MTLFSPMRPAGRLALTMLSVVALSGGAALGAASSSSQDRFDWARTALERNGALEVVATDPATGVITVRIKRTGELRRVRADEVIAALPAGAATAASVAAPSADASTAAAETGRAGQAQPGRVLLSGPGYRISAVGPAAEAPSTAAAAQTNGGAQLISVPLEHRHDPIVCQGARLLHIDNRNLQFDGDAVSAENGCEVHITNSRIVANGVGITARGASVHIDNSSIEGGAGAVDADSGAQVYARSSTFKGLIRRLDGAGFHDMGGNVGN